MEKKCKHKFRKHNEDTNSNTGIKEVVYYCDYCGIEKIVPVIDMCQKALEYVMNVTEKQEKILSFDDMFQGYKSVMGNMQLTEYGFKTVYDAYIETLKEHNLIY